MRRKSQITIDVMLAPDSDSSYFLTERLITPFTWKISGKSPCKYSGLEKSLEDFRLDCFPVIFIRNLAWKRKKFHVRHLNSVTMFPKLFFSLHLSPFVRLSRHRNPNRKFLKKYKIDITHSWQCKTRIKKIS